MAHDMFSINMLRGSKHIVHSKVIYLKNSFLLGMFGVCKKIIPKSVHFIRMATWIYPENNALSSLFSASVSKV